MTQIRSLLGTNSYELFTLDKLLSKLVKHMQVQKGKCTSPLQLGALQSCRPAAILAFCLTVDDLRAWFTPCIAADRLCYPAMPLASCS
jgi:hypothetical protein